MSGKWLRRAHSDENACVQKFVKARYPALRIPGSGASKYFPGDVLAFTPHCIKLILVRRRECRIKEDCKNCPRIKAGKECDADSIVFWKDEIMDVRKLASRIASLVYPNSVMVELRAHFPKQRKWVEKILLDWDGGDVTVRIYGKR